MLAAGKLHRQYLYSIRNICKDGKEITLGWKTLKSRTHILQTLVPLPKHAADLCLYLNNSNKATLYKGSYNILKVYCSFP